MIKKNALLIFVKNPEIGKVKTRLAATLGAEKALDVYLQLLQHTRKVATAVSATRYLFYSQFIDSADDWSPQFFNKKVQVQGNLGTKIAQAFESVLAHHTKAVIIGSDCPSLHPSHVEEAFKFLDTHDFVIGPAKDGGYYLLGMKDFSPSLFQNMSWSTATVFEDTLTRIEKIEKTYALLEKLSDVDYEEDLQEWQNKENK